MELEEYRVTWEADDGYVTGSRPHSFEIDTSNLDLGMSEQDLLNLFWESVQVDFERRVSPVTEQEEDFLEWAKEKIEEMKAEEKA